MNYRSIIFYKFVSCALLLLFISPGSQAQSYLKNANTVQGTLQLDSIWAPVVYLSHISSFNELYTMSNEMIIAEASIDSLGNFSFIPDYLPEEDQLFRIHISKKGAPAASLIIGGNEENHLFIIANKSSRVVLSNKDQNRHIGTSTFEGYAPNRSLKEIDQIASYTDSTHFNGSNMKQEFVTKAIQEKLRFVADTASHPLVSLYALHKSNFESNVPVNLTYYENYLEKWQGERSSYFNSFRAQLPIKKNSDTLYYVLIGLGFFILGFFLNRFLKHRNKQNKSQLESLSVQERKIYNLLKMGRSNKEISEEYSIGLSTVKSHVSSIYSKLNVKSRKEAMDFK
ncbi:MAG: LuxR C-terminal-related transcriptional regulator [Bacteroidota bacterium]